MKIATMRTACLLNNVRINNCRNIAIKNSNTNNGIVNQMISRHLSVGVDPKAVKEVTTAIDQKKKDDTQNNVDADASNKDIATEEFQSATNELFKLGKMPSEHKDGPMLDAGSTIMKAMSSFDPETTSKMTNDTKQLLETQKSLMGMLTQMRPILADGKELLQTFSGMFGGQAK
jgi:hypothetical protein